MRTLAALRIIVLFGGCERVDLFTGGLARATACSGHFIFDPAWFAEFVSRRVICLGPGRRHQQLWKKPNIRLGVQIGRNLGALQFSFQFVVVSW